MRSKWISGSAQAFARTFRRPRRLAAAGAVFIASCSASLLGGCVAQVDTHGERIEADRVAAIRPGAQSRDDVAELLGSPSSTSVFGEETWYYVSDVVKTRSIFNREVVDREVITIRFDQRGVVEQVDEFGLERGREVALVDRETPSFGESDNVVQQLLGNLGKFNAAGAPPRR